MVAYHDAEWGVPTHDDRRLFEFLVLEGAQAGLSWMTILRKRDAYRRAFYRFDPARVARMTTGDVERLLEDDGIVRNRRKIESAIANARVVLDIQKEVGSFDGYAWSFVESAAMSKDLIRRGASFVGPTICYAFMQATGIVNDHQVTCFRYKEVPRTSPGR